MEMKLLEGFLSLACFFLNTAKSHCSCNCNGKLCRTAFIGRDHFSINAGIYCFFLGFKKFDVLGSELNQLQALFLPI